MPTRNALVLACAIAVSIASYVTAAHNRYAATVSKAMNLVRERYVDEVDDDALFAGAMNGLARQLDDYSAYFPKQQNDEFQEQLDQEFGGVGILVELDAERLRVRTPLVGSPAWAAGVLPDDVVIGIDGDDATTIDLRDATRRLRGKPGSKVKLRLERASSPEPIDVELARDRINIEFLKGDHRQDDGSWEFRMRDEPRIGYVRLVEFGEKTAGDLERALTALKEGPDPAKGMILDLRQNPGGLLDRAAEICDMFMEGGRIVTTKGRGGRVDRALDANPGVVFPADIPMVVLVDGQSASASEIVAACLQDHGRAKVGGQRTWGKGSVQSVVPLGGDRGAFKITIATFWRPSEKNMQKMRNDGDDADWGVRPDPELALTLDDAKTEAWIKSQGERDVQDLRRVAFRRVGLEDPLPNAASALDEQLERAIDYLRGVVGAE